MSVIGFILLVIFAWFSYNLLVKVVLPVYRTTRQIRRQFKNISRQRGTPPPPDTAAPPAEAPAQKVGEYIDFEEVQ